VRVALISYTPNPELVIAAAARASTSRREWDFPLESEDPQKIHSFLSKLLAAGHLSPFEHASFTFAIEGISRVASHQLVRHRIASYVQQSQRYTPISSPNFVIPPTIASNPKYRGEFERIFNEAFKLYSQMAEDGIPLEDARYILPSAVETRLIMTMNARELLHVCSLRLCNRSQWEIRELFKKVKEEVSKVAPFLGSHLLPKCHFLGYCNELESCGLFPKRSEKEEGECRLRSSTEGR